MVVGIRNDCGFVSASVVDCGVSRDVQHRNVVIFRRCTFVRARRQKIFSGDLIAHCATLSQCAGDDKLVIPVINDPILL